MISLVFGISTLYCNLSAILFSSIPFCSIESEPLLQPMIFNIKINIVVILNIFLIKNPP